MKKKKRIILFFVLFFLFASNAFAEYQKVECVCKCKGVKIGAVGLALKGITDIGGVTREADAACHMQCAKTCGGFTDFTGDSKKCAADCDSFCKDTANGYDGGGTGLDVQACKDSCTSTCESKSLVKSIVDFIYVIAGIVGAIMLVIHGIRLALARDAEGRDNAKSSIWHVIIALIIIALAGSAVELFSNPAKKIEPAPSTIEGGQDCASRCGSGVRACTEEWCYTLYGCWYMGGKIGGSCVSCSKAKVCRDYGPSKIGCETNACEVEGGGTKACEFVNSGWSEWIQEYMCEPANAASDDPKCWDCRNLGLWPGSCDKAKCESRSGCWWGGMPEGSMMLSDGECYYCDAKYVTSKYTPLTNGCSAYNTKTSCTENKCNVPGGCIPDKDPGMTKCVPV